MQAVRHFTQQVTAADGVSPFDEQTLLDIANPDAATSYALIFQPRADDGVAGEVPTLLGFAAADLRNNSLELAVHPRARRQGYGTALLGLSKELPGGTVWAHGNLPAALAFAQHNMLPPVRELLVLERKIVATAHQAGAVYPAQAMPTQAGWQLDTFQPDDLPELVALNSRAFAQHPEQGQLVATDFTQRFAQDWFDPQLLYLLRPAQSQTKRSAAQRSAEQQRIKPQRAKLGGFVWLKPDPPQVELYVLGVDPAEQGQGLGSYLIQVALHAAWQNGYQKIVLYVDGANLPAVRAYTRAQFTVQARHTAFRVPQLAKI